MKKTLENLWTEYFGEKCAFLSKARSRTIPTIFSQKAKLDNF